MRFYLKFLVLMPWMGFAASAQQVTPGDLIGNTPYESPSCTLKDHHEFDFMHGAWDLRLMVDGKWMPGGYSIHKAALGGCVSFDIISFENLDSFYKGLTGRTGYAGFAVSSYDKKAGNWHQIWHDDMGSTVASFRGRRFKDGMRFVGHAPGENGTELQRLEWKITGQDIREYSMDMSTDGGQEWTRIITVQMVRQKN